MNKQVIIGEESKKLLLKGITKISEAVIATMGPGGRNVIIEGDNFPISTKDGISVAESITLKEPTENIGASLIKQAARRTASKAGDGTTTTTLLSYKLIKNGLELITPTTNVVDVKKGMEIAKDEILGYLSNNKKDVTKDKLLDIATISSNGDKEIGKLIVDAIESAGLDGIITIEESKTGESYLNTVDGMKFDRGYKSPYFVTDNNSMTCVLDKPHVLLYDGKITVVKDLLKILNGVAQSSNNSLLIIAEDIDGEALSTLIVNKTRGVLKVVCVKAPEFGEYRTQSLEDIGILTNSTVCSTKTGLPLDKVEAKHLGKCERVIVNKDSTIIIGGNGEVEKLEGRCNEIKHQIEKAESNSDKERLKLRLGKLIGGVSVINVGGLTEVEMKEKKDRVDDALHATRAAVEEGIVPGGGMALLKYSYTNSTPKELDINNQDILNGFNLVKLVCIEPYNIICKNAGKEIKNEDILTKDFWKGHDIKNDIIINMLDNGIIDPFKVTRLALENSISLASTVLLTEAVVCNEEEKKDELKLPFNV